MISLFPQWKTKSKLCFPSHHIAYECSKYMRRPAWRIENEYKSFISHPLFFLMAHSENWNEIIVKRNVGVGKNSDNDVFYCVYLGFGCGKIGKITLAERVNFHRMKAGSLPWHIGWQPAQQQAMWNRRGKRWLERSRRRKPKEKGKTKEIFLNHL